jgi:hypothetical protein
MSSSRSWLKLRRWSAKKVARWPTGELPIADSLIVLVENKFKGLKLLKKWTVPSPEGDKLVALQAEVSKL